MSLLKRTHHLQSPWLPSVFASLVLLAALAFPATADTETPAGNAATVYRQALALMPEITMEENAWLHGLHHRDGREMLDKKGQAKFLKSLEPSVQRARGAAAMPHCDWGPPVIMGGRVKWPSLNPMRRLALAVLRQGEAKYPGDPNGFVADTLAAAATGRHLGRGETLNHFTSEVAVEREVVESLALRLPELPEDTLTLLASKWQTLPPANDYCDALERDKAMFLDGVMIKLRAETNHEKSTAIALRFLREHFEIAEKDRLEFDAWAHKIAADAGMSLPGILHEVNADYDRWVTGMCLPPIEHERWAAQFKLDHAGLNPLSRVIVPDGDKGKRVYYDGERARSRMLSTAIKVLRHGPDAVKRSVDPFGNGRFTYRETADGFELQSQRKGVTLRVGEAPKQ